MRHRVLALLLVALGAWPAWAGTSRSWSASTSDELGAGTLDGTSLDREGRLVLAPELVTLWGPDEGIVWAVQPAGPDAAFVALSGPGRALRVESGQEAELWYRTADEGLVTSMVADGAGGVLLGLSPEGRVVHLVGPGRVERELATDSAFVWALAIDDDGLLWAGTGVPGAILREESGGAWSTLLETGDDPVRCMVPLAGGGVVVGTGGRGRVIRVDPGGEAFVLYDADEPEIVSLAVGAEGTIYALATRGAKQVGPAQRTRTPDNSVRVSAAAPEGESPSGAENAPATPPASGKQRLRAPAGGALYRLGPEGAVRRLWRSENEMPFAVVRDAGGRILVSTGDSGRIHALDPEGRTSSLLRIASNQASAMATAADGRVLVAGSTDARVERLGPELVPRGRYTSPVIDAGTPAEWGRIHWDAEVPRGAGIEVEARAGNTSEPDETWSGWSDLDGSSDGHGVASALPPGRWLQIRLTLTSGREESPVLRALEAFYFPQNRPPEIERLSVEPAGIAWVRGPSQSASRSRPLVADDPVARRTTRSMLGQSRAGNGIRKAYEVGARTFHWEARDADGDRLSYSLYIRREGEAHWFPLTVDRRESFYSWDARGTPDGVYRLQLVADDEMDNPRGKALRHDVTSVAFRIDNTRPSLGSPEIERSGDEVDVEFVARDPGGAIAAVEVALGGGDWSPIDPLDGVADSDEERYLVELGDRGDLDATGEGYSLRVRVTDAAGNLGGQMWRID